ncbi:MAG TPA: hypothetical protein VF714_11995 [Jatrophihabitans sp.]
MTAPQHDDLEHRLTELFQQRASTVTRARPVEFGSGEGPRKALAAPKQVRLGTHRQNLGVLAAAAAVFVAIAATVLGIQTSRNQPAPPLGTGSHPASKPTATATPTGPKACVVSAPASWAQAIAAGTVPVDRGLNTVVSANSHIRDYLVVQGNEPPRGTSAIYSNVELALFHGATGRTIYTPAKSSDIPVADATGAISADWIAFAVTRPQNLDNYKVLLYDRGTGSVTTLAEATEQHSADGKGFIGSPVIAAGKVYWLAWTFNKPATTTLDSWDLTRHAPAGSVPVPNASQLISYGSGMLVSYTADGRVHDPAAPDRTKLRNAAGVPLTQEQLAAAMHGFNLGYDGSSRLSWLRYDGDSIGYSWLTVGYPPVHHEGLLMSVPGAGFYVAPGGYAHLADGVNGVLDLRTRTVVTLPAGVSLQAMVGDTAIFGTGTTKSGASGLSAVQRRALKPTRCRRN